MKEKELPRVSVIIPCYNQAIYLSETLDSVLEQTYSNWEAIIVNDGSPDHTEVLALEYARKDARIKYVYKENGGLSSARNRGIECALGEFILPLDADDIIKPEYIALAMEAFDKNPQTKVVYCLCFFFGVKNGLWEDLHYRGYKELLLGNSIFCSTFFRKSDWKEIGGYDEQMLTGHEDWEFFIRLLKEEDIVYQIPLPLFYYRTKETSMLTMASRADVFIETEYYIYTKNRAIYSSYFVGGVLTLFRELEEFKRRREKRRNKWYRKFYHQYIKK